MTATGTVSGSAPSPSSLSFGSGGHTPTLTGAGSTFDAPFFAVAFAKYHQQHPGWTPYDELVELPVMVILLFTITRLTNRRKAAMTALDEVSQHNVDL